ncbi:MAG: hypothetical protein ACYC8T_11435 [Myxococcaceae bacterium]
MARALPFALLLLAGSAPAETEDPTRAVDRIFFGVYGGVGQVTARHVAAPAGTDARAVVGGPAWTAGFGVGIWPTDYLGIDLSFEAMDLSLGQPAPSAQSFSGFGLRLSPGLRLALPLRYVAPYVGAGPALLLPFFSSGSGSGELNGSPGPSFGIRYFAGSSIYLTRDVRLFVDLQLVPLELAAPMVAKGQKTPAGTQTIEGGFARYLTLGVAFTPDDFKSSPNKAGWVMLPVGVAAAATALALVFSLPKEKP